MKKILFAFMVLQVTSLAVFGQIESQQFIKKHLVRASASIVSGYMYKSNIKNVHLNGNLEYYIDNKVSIRGDYNILLGSDGLTDQYMGLKDDHNVMLGAVFHIQTKGYFDPYIILQPGIGYTSSYIELPSTMIANGESNKKYYEGVLSPVGSAGIGFNYYFQRFAHLFMETRYMYGQHLSKAPSPISLEELRITFGLGFNVFVIKDKKKPA
ncbi:MAG: hypothetical protein JNL69_00470 [Bacteroidia bacterium]|nr:hypothetical protein [Bacteroidia bacterium]